MNFISNRAQTFEYIFWYNEHGVAKVYGTEPITILKDKDFIHTFVL